MALFTRLPLTWTVNSLILAFVGERLIYITSDKTSRPIYFFGGGLRVLRNGKKRFTLSGNHYIGRCVFSPESRKDWLIFEEFHVALFFLS